MWFVPETPREGGDVSVGTRPVRMRGTSTCGLVEVLTVQNESDVHFLGDGPQRAGHQRSTRASGPAQASDDVGATPPQPDDVGHVFIVGLQRWLR